MVLVKPTDPFLDGPRFAPSKLAPVRSCWSKAAPLSLAPAKFAERKDPGGSVRKLWSVRSCPRKSFPVAEGHFAFWAVAGIDRPPAIPSTMAADNASRGCISKLHFSRAITHPPGTGRVSSLAARKLAIAHFRNAILRDTRALNVHFRLLYPNPANRPGIASP